MIIVFWKNELPFQISSDSYIFELHFDIKCGDIGYYTLLHDTKCVVFLIRAINLLAVNYT